MNVSNIFRRLRLIKKILFYKNDEVAKISKEIEKTSKREEKPVIHSKPIYNGVMTSEIFIDRHGLSQVIALKNGEIITFSKLGLITLFDVINMTLKLEINLENDLDDNNWILVEGGNCCSFIERKNIIVAIARYYFDSEDSEYGGPERFIIYWIDKSTFKIIKKENLKYPIYALYTSTTEEFLIGRTNNGIIYFNIYTFCIEKKDDLKVNNRIYLDDQLRILITCYSESFPFNHNFKIINQDSLAIIKEIKAFEKGTIDAITYSLTKKWIAIYSTNEKLLKIFNLDNNDFTYNIPIEYNESDIPIEMKFSNDGIFLALKLRYSVIIFETNTFKIVCNLKHINKNGIKPSEDGYIEDISFFNGDKNILTTTSDGYLRVWK